MRDGSRWWRGRVRPAPLPVEVVAAGALTSVGSLGLFGLVHLVTGWPHDPDWIEIAVRQFLVGAVVTGVVAPSVRRSGGVDAQRSAQVALQRRRLPGDGDPAVLRRALGEQRRIAVRARRWVVALLPLLAAGLFWLAVAEGGPELWVAGGAVAVAAVLVPVALRHRVELVDELLDDLESRDPGDVPGPPAP